MENSHLFYFLYLKASQRHLENNNVCFEFYKQRFNVDSWISLKSSLLKLIRPSYASRSSLKRKFENIQLANRKKDAKTITQSLNDYRRQIALCNYRLCIVCGQYFLSSGAIQVPENDPLFTQLDLNNKLSLKRMNSFWICLKCQSTGGKTGEFTTAKSILNVVEIDGHKILYPGTNADESISIDVDNLILIPRRLYPKYKKMTKVHVVGLYKNLTPTNEFISTLYLNRVAKYALRNLYSEIYNGEISLNENKKLQSISGIYDDSNIRLSSSWLKKRRNNIYSQFKQYGPSAISFCLDVDLHNIESIVTSLLCNGSVITLGFEGNGYNEFKTKYYYHSHENSDPCGENCNKTELQDITNSLDAKFIPLFIAREVFIKKK